METLLKQSVGIDISKDTFMASICCIYQSGKMDFTTTEPFKNVKTGFNQFVKWVRKNSSKEVQITFLMEATGVYYEQLAYHLHKLSFQISVLLPNKVKNYAKCLNIKTKTDKVDAKVIARMGAEQNLSLWTPPTPVYQQMRLLTRYYQELKKQKTALQNRIEALNHSVFADDFVVQSYQEQLSLLDKQIELCEKKLKTLVKEDEELASKFENVETIKGVGFITIAIVVAETQGFSLITNRKQLASYAGLDVIERQSGTSVRGKSKISKKGNSHIRAALYFPAMVSSVRNVSLRNDYQRIIKHKPNKKIGLVAVQRKLLLLIFTLWKNNEKYQERE